MAGADFAQTQSAEERQRRKVLAQRGEFRTCCRLLQMHEASRAVERQHALDVGPPRPCRDVVRRLQILGLDGPHDAEQSVLADLAGAHDGTVVPDGNGNSDQRFTLGAVQREGKDLPLHHLQRRHPLAAPAPVFAL